MKTYVVYSYERVNLAGPFCEEIRVCQDEDIAIDMMQTLFYGRLNRLRENNIQIVCVQYHMMDMTGKSTGEIIYSKKDSEGNEIRTSYNVSVITKPVE